jgi:FkbM family methyltransferase
LHVKRQHLPVHPAPAPDPLALRRALIAAFLALWRRLPVRGGGFFLRLLAGSDLERIRDTQVTVNSVRYRISAVNPPELELLLWRRYEPDLMEIVDAAVDPGSVVVDVGANCGVVAMALRRRTGPHGRVIAIDPSPRACARIREQVELNGFTNVAVIEAAVGETATEAVFSYGKVGLGALPSHDTSLTTGAHVATRVAPLDQLLEDTHATRAGFVKIDTDGSESWVLRGATRTLEDARPVIAFELYAPGLARRGESPAELAEILSRFDYELFEPVTVDLPWLARPMCPRAFRRRSLSDLASGLIGFGNLVAIPADSRGAAVRAKLRMTVR